MSQILSKTHFTIALTPADTDPCYCAKFHEILLTMDDIYYIPTVCHVLC